MSLREEHEHPPPGEERQTMQELQELSGTEEPKQGCLGWPVQTPLHRPSTGSRTLLPARRAWDSVSGSRGCIPAPLTPAGTSEALPGAADTTQWPRASFLHSAVKPGAPRRREAV